ncbi:MAG: hypothetical protein JW940_25565 [Polyangiaceae bacterium]|nr:hypothetical protein [Polyangiaceae bacterium]
MMRSLLRPPAAMLAALGVACMPPSTQAVRAPARPPTPVASPPARGGSRTAEAAPPQRQQTAASAFRNGEATDPARCEGGERSGAALEQAGLVVEQVARALPGRTESNTECSELDALGLSAHPGARPVVVRWRKPGSKAAVVSYWFVPWQPLQAEERRDAPTLGPQLLTVTELALVFGPVWEGNDEAALTRAIEQAVETALNVAALEKELPPDFAVPLPESLRLLDCKSFAHYVTLAVAVPGSRMPPDAALQRIAPDRMIRVILTPDIGPRTTRWLAPVGRAAESAAVHPRDASRSPR